MPDNKPTTNKPKAMGWKRMFTTMRYSILGFKAAWKNEESFRQQVYVSLIGILLSLFIGRSWVEFVLLLGSLMLILIVELINSALEATVDRISTDFHELSGRAKDLGSAAAMLTMSMAACIWGTLLLMRLLGY